jgi:Concanavalin A-like lectin/glucanases superfamily
VLPFSRPRARRRGRLTAVVAAASMATAGLTAIAMPAQASTAAGKPASSASGSSAAPASGLLSAAQAAAKAKATGAPVVASALTTAYEQITANPQGGYTLSESAAPARAWKNGAWAPLDSTLRRGSDGGYSPTTSTSALRLSGGGLGPVATLDANGQVMSLTLPVSLPAPTVSGSEATYANVIPGVDLTVTVADTGAFSDTFVVHSASAAADPRLASLLSASVKLSRGLKESADPAGNITVSTGKQAVFEAPTPYAWDSATAAATPAAHGSASAATNSAATASASAAVPPSSSVSGPGSAAHFVRLGVTASATSTTLAPPTSLFTEKDPEYPIYVDPWYSPTYGANGWASFGSASDTSGTNRWDSTPDTEGDAFVGNTGVSSIGVVWSAFNFQLPDTGSSTSSNLVGATIHSATFGIVAVTSGSCSGFDEQVNLYAPDAAGGNYLQKGNATYDHWSGANIGGVVADDSFTGSSTCGGSGAGGFGITSQIQTEVSSTRAGNQTFILRADDETDVAATKRFPVTLSNAGNPTLTVSFDKEPNVPTGLTLSTGHACGSTLGDSSTALESKATSPMNSELTTTFDLYKTSDSGQTNLLTSAHGIASDQYTTASGQYSIMPLSEAFLKSVSGNALTSFTWKAADTDNTLPETGWSSTCSFSYDPTRPGAPTATFAANSSGYTCVIAEAMTSTTAQQVGSSCAITFSPAPTTTGSISGYVYQVNQQSPVKVSSTSSITVSFTVPQLVNTLTVDALSAGGNIGEETTVHFDGNKLSPAAVDGSVANDGEPDLLVSGGSGAAFPAGLWLTQTHADGSTGATPVNIGVDGLGFGNTKIPAQEWDGADVITGDFCGLGAQDVMAYFPTGANAGGGAVDCSDGSVDGLTQGSPLEGGTSDVINAGTFQDADDDNAADLANAYNISGLDDGAPDLFAASTAGLYLYSSKTPNTYSNDGGWGCSQDCDFLSGQDSPDGTADWQNWTITSAQQANGETDMYLWDASAGELVLWTDVTLNTGAGLAYPNATSLSYNSTILELNDWNEAATDISLRAVVFAGENTPTLFVTNTSNGSVTTFSLGSSTQVGTVTHSFPFQDMPSGDDNTEAGTSADVVGGLTLTGSTAGALWHTGDAFSPDVMLNTQTDNQTSDTALHGSLTASGNAVALNADFTVAVSVRPNAAGGVMLSQSGTNTAGFTVGASASGQWQFCLAQSDAASPAQDCATGGTEQQDVWSNIVATYSAESGFMSLYVDGTEVADNDHTKVAGFTGDFLIGDGRTSSSAFGGYYSGQVANIFTAASVMPPVASFGTGSSYVPLTPFRLVDTRSTSKVGSVTGPIAASSGFAVKPGGVGGIPTTGVTAISAIVTVPTASGNGVLTVYPDGDPLPVSSTLNYNGTQDETNGVVAALGTDGEFDVYNAGVAVQVIVDVTGYFTTNTTTTNASTYVPITPDRALDTRSGVGGVPTAKIAAGSKDVLALAGKDGLPSSGLTAVAINLTVTEATSGAIIEAYQDGISLPLVSSVSTGSGGTASAMTIVPIGSDGSIDIYNAGLAGTSADVVGDISGYFSTGTTGEFYHAIAPIRMSDSRQSGGPLAENAYTYYDETAISANQPTIVANVTETSAGSSGTLTVYPMYMIDPGSIDDTSTIDYSATSTYADMDLIDCNDAGGLSSFQVQNTTGSPQLIIDVTGFFAFF